MNEKTFKADISFEAGVYIECDAIDQQTGALDLRKIYLHATPSSEVRELHVTATISSKEPLIDCASVSVFPDPGESGLISAIVDRFQCYFWGINARLAPFQAQFTRQARQYRINTRRFM